MKFRKSKTLANFSEFTVYMILFFTILALTSEYKENNKDDSSDIGVVNQQEQQLLQDLKEAKRQQDGLSSLCQEGQQNLGVLREEKDRLEAEKERLENETTVIIPKRRFVHRCSQIVNTS